MKTALEILTAAGLELTYWGLKIIEAESCCEGRFSRDDQDKAGGWCTCACGKLSQDIPRDYLGKPEDETLARLGYDFMGYVESSIPDKAARTLIKIERRAAELVVSAAEKRKAVTP